LFDAALGDRFSCCTINDGDGGWFIQWQGNVPETNYAIAFDPALEQQDLSDEGE
jgi:hypothetical protein